MTTSTDENVQCIEAAKRLFGGHPRGFLTRDVYSDTEEFRKSWNNAWRIIGGCIAEDQDADCRELALKAARTLCWKENRPTCPSFYTELHIAVDHRESIVDGRKVGTWSACDADVRDIIAECGRLLGI